MSNDTRPPCPRCQVAGPSFDALHENGNQLEAAKGRIVNTWWSGVIEDVKVRTREAVVTAECSNGHVWSRIVPVSAELLEVRRERCAPLKSVVYLSDDEEHNVVTGHLSDDAIDPHDPLLEPIR